MGQESAVQQGFRLLKRHRDRYAAMLVILAPEESRTAIGPVSVAQRGVQRVACNAWRNGSAASRIGSIPLIQRCIDRGFLSPIDVTLKQMSGPDG